MARRTKADAQRTRRAILAAARRLFETRGYAETSLAQITEAAGITKGALFHHFAGKEALFREIWTALQREMDEEARKAANAARSPSDPYAAFLAGCRTYLGWASRPDYQQIVLIDGPSVLGLAGWYEADDDLGRQNVRAGIDYLASKGIVDPARVPALSVLVHNALNGAGFAIARGEAEIDAPGLMSALEAMLRALR